MNAENARQEEEEGAEAKAAALAEERYRVSVQWAQAWRRADAAQAGSGPCSGHLVPRPQRRVPMSSITSRHWTAGNPRSSSTKAGSQFTGCMTAGPTSCWHSERYPDDRENRYYWNKKRMPKIRALRKWTDIRVTRNDRNGLWEFPEEADKWI